MKILTIGEFDNKLFLKKHYKDRAEQINKIKFIYLEEENQILFCLKDIFDCTGYAKNYFYKFYYAIDQNQFLTRNLNDSFYAQINAFVWWLDIRLNKSTKTEELRKFVNILLAFITKNMQEMKNKSKNTYSLQDFLED